MNVVRIVVPTVLALLAAACAPFQPSSGPSPAAPAARDEGTQLARTAMAQVGAAYRYGGASPSQGFDCSGLVSYVFGQQGIVVPRTAAQQYLVAQPIREQDLQPGDLVFFRLEPASRDVTHVGIYTGQGRFVHAPQTGRRVGEASLWDDYYRPRIAGYGRFYGPAEAHAAPR